MQHLILAIANPKLEEVRPGASCTVPMIYFNPITKRSGPQAFRRCRREYSVEHPPWQSARFSQNSIAFRSACLGLLEDRASFTTIVIDDHITGDGRTVALGRAEVCEGLILIPRKRSPEERTINWSAEVVFELTLVLDFKRIGDRPHAASTQTPSLLDRSSVPERQEAANACGFR